MPGNPNPSPSTRFQPGNKSGKGRPRGYSQSTLRKHVNMKLDQMLGDAHKNIQKSLKKGDVGTSRWLVERVAKERGTCVDKGLLEPLVSALESIDDVEQISQQCVLLAIKGDMSFEQVQAVQEALARHSVLAGTIELRRLREEVDRLAGEKKADLTLDAKHLPAWGKLKDVSPNATSGEDAGAGE